MFWPEVSLLLPSQSLIVCTYLSGALLSKDSCLNADPPCLCQCYSPLLATLVPDIGPTSASITAITATVAAWRHIHDYCLNCSLLCHFSLHFCNSLIIFGVTLVTYLRILLMTPCNVISLECNSTNVSEYDNSFSAYFHLPICHITFIYILGACLGCGLCLLLRWTLLV